MAVNKESAPQILTGNVHSPLEVHKNAIDVLSWAGRIVLYDHLRPGQVNSRISQRGSWIVHERDFVIVIPPDTPKPLEWEYIPTLLTHRERGYAVRQQFALSLSEQETIIWNGGGDEVLFCMPDQLRIPLSTQAISDAANLLLSPLFINHNRRTGEFEFDMPPPYPDQQSHFPIGTIRDAMAAFRGLASFLAVTPNQQHPDDLAIHG